MIFRFKKHISFLLFFCLIGYIFLLNIRTKPEKHTIQTQKVINNYERKMLDVLNRTIDIYKESNLKILYQEAFDKFESAITVLIFKNDSLLFWSDNLFSELNSIPQNITEKDILLTKNGWYYQKHIKVENLMFIALLHVKNEYNYENNFLDNSFGQIFNFKEAKPELTLNKGKHNIYDLSGNFLFEIVFDKHYAFSKPKQKKLFVLYLIVFFIVSFYLYKLCLKRCNKDKNAWVIFLFFSVLLIFLRFYSFYFRLPTFLYALDIFSPVYYASSVWIPSLGDMVWHTSTLFLIICFFIKTISLGEIHSKRVRYMLISVLGFALLFLFYVSISVLKSLVYNSNIYLLFNNFYELSFNSFIGIISLGLLLYAFHLLSIKFVSFSIKFLNKRLFIILLFLMVIIVFFTNSFELLSALCYLAYIGVLFYYLNKNKSENNTTLLLSSILIFSFLSIFQVYKHTDIKEKERRKLLAVNLSSDTDPLAEFLFMEMATELKKDTLLLAYLKNHIANEEKILTHLKNNYFSGFWAKYDIQLTICETNEKLILRPENIEIDCADFFKDLIATFGRPTASPLFYQMLYVSGRNAYLADLPFYFDDTRSYKTIYVELLSKFIPKQLGYPDLLIDKNVRINTSVFDYNYAKYRDGKLTQQFGKFFYFINVGNYNLDKQTFVFFDIGSYNHLYYRVDDTLEIIISKPNYSFIDFFAGFSYYFIILAALWFLLQNIFIHFSITPSTLNFSNRVKIAMVFMVLISFIVIGLVTLRFIVNIYNNKSNDNISEKAHSILIELENKMAHIPKITPDMHDYIKELLVKYSGIFFTDINVYDLQGNLLASSREKIFDEGLISEKMNTHAFYIMTYERKTFFAHNENIGRLNYLSAYIPFRNLNNETIAYINLPYFAKESEQRQEIASFLATFINIYIFLIALSIIIALLLSRYVTNPLIMIKEKLSRFKLGKVNEKINWQKNDEIGSLVNEYNRLIDELERSAEMLARSERESAWREMAKQVAHEIKNPLTPMKLSVQHLQKSWNDMPDTFEDRLQKFTAMMIDQIDTLSDIAGSFSDFAKMPISLNETFDLQKTVAEVLRIFETTPDIKVINHINTSKAYFVIADKKQLKRALYNLVKNAIQATEGAPDGIIEIDVQSKTGFYVLSVKDNGEGISKELWNKIFLPNFTTKNSGMGLGLAIVKSIVEGCGGQVYFESVQESGTTFFVELPKSKF